MSSISLPLFILFPTIFDAFLEHLIILGCFSLEAHGWTCALQCLDQVASQLLLLGFPNASVCWSFLWGHLSSSEMASPVSCGEPVLLSGAEWGRVRRLSSSSALIFLGRWMFPFWSFPG